MTAPTMPKPVAPLMPKGGEDLLCPMARMFGAPVAPYCRGAECAAWRWQPLSADLLTPHVTKKMAEIGKGPVAHKEATTWVMENRVALGIPTDPTHGYCGLGGKP